MQNLNFLLFPGRALCVDEQGEPCIPLRPFLVGDTVFSDANGDGIQQLGEPGIANVTLEILDHANSVLATTTTDANGHYSFPVETGGYTVRISADNFNPGGILQGYQSTTPQQCFASIVNANVDNCDFGYRGTASLGDRLWIDADGDGVQDAGETGLNGITVELLDSANNVVATATTAGDGNYSFTHLAPGTYTVRVVAATLPAGLAPTFDADGTATPDMATVTVGPGASLDTVDFGYRGTASLGDRVWLDADGDGLQDSSEPGLSGVTVELLDSNGNVTATDTTAAGGLYSFNNLAAGTYTVRVDASTLPAGLAATYDFDGTDTLNTANVTLAGGETRGDVDFGYRGTAALGDRVWADANANGVQDAGETGLNGVTVELYDGDGNLVDTTVTSGNGTYTFNHLPFGTYTVSVVASTLPVGVVPSFDRDGTASAHTATVSLAPGEALMDVDFGYRGTTSLGDRVWNDLEADGVQDAGETGINGVTIRLYDANGNLVATTTTAGDGEYSFSSLLPGTYSVQVDLGTLPAGFAPTYDIDGTGTANVANVTLAAGASRSDVDFGYYRAPSNPGTGTIGYWKNHSEAWPVNQITVGGVTYTKSQAISLMGGPSRGDKTIDLFKQLVASKLNVIIDNDASCIASTIASADAWLAIYPVGSNVKSSSSAWTVAGPLHQRLDDYNNGRLCAPHRD